MIQSKELMEIESLIEDSLDRFKSYAYSLKEICSRIQSLKGQDESVLAERKLVGMLNKVQELNKDNNDILSEVVAV